MSKKLTIFLMGVFAMILATAPAQAQSMKDRIAQIRSQQTMRKYSPVMNKVREAKMAELQAAHPKFFRGHGIHSFLIKGSCLIKACPRQPILLSLEKNFPVRYSSPCAGEKLYIKLIEVNKWQRK